MNNEKIRKERFWNRTSSFWGPSQTAPFMPAKWAGQPVLVRWQLERPMYYFENSFSPAFVYIHWAKYIFSRDMFCLPHFWAKIHGVKGNPLPYNDVALVRLTEPLPILEISDIFPICLPNYATPFPDFYKVKIYIIYHHVCVSLNFSITLQCFNMLIASYHKLSQTNAVAYS